MSFFEEIDTDYLLQWVGVIVAILVSLAAIGSIILALISGFEFVSQLPDLLEALKSRIAR